MSLSKASQEIVKCMPDWASYLEWWEQTEEYADLQEYLKAEIEFNKTWKAQSCGEMVRRS